MSTNDFEERVVTVPLRGTAAGANHRRADSAMSIVRSHLARQFGVDEGNVRLDPSINETVWARGRRKPPRKLRVRAARFVEAGERLVEAEIAD